MHLSRTGFSVLLLFLLDCPTCWCQIFQISENDSDAIEEARSCGKDLIDDFKIGMESFISVTEMKFQSAPESKRFFESNARLERLEDKGSVWMKNSWRTKDIVDDRTEKEKTKSLPSFKNCDAELLIVESRLFELVKRNVVGIDGKIMPAKLHKRQPYEVFCGFGVAPKELPFVSDTCFTTAFLCDKNLETTFSDMQKCIAAVRSGNKLDTYWIGYITRPESVEAVTRIVFEDRLPVLHELYFRDAGYKLSDTKFDLRKDRLVAQVKTQWKRFDLLSVPSHVEAKFLCSFPHNGYTEMFLEADVQFFPSDSKEFEKAKDQADKLIARARELMKSNESEER